MLAEQLFRATSILANHPYHRGVIPPCAASPSRSLLCPLLSPASAIAQQGGEPVPVRRSRRRWPSRPMPTAQTAWLEQGGGEGPNRSRTTSRAPARGGTGDRGGRGSDRGRRCKAAADVGPRRPPTGGKLRDRAAADLLVAFWACHHGSATAATGACHPGGTDDSAQGPSAAPRAQPCR